MRPATSGPAVPRHATDRPPAPRVPVPARVAGSLVRVPRPDYSDPASVAAAFYIAWASVDALHDGPDTYVARCAPLVTTSLEQQLADGQPATAAWQAMRRDREVSLLHVRAVTHPDGAPAPTSSMAYLRVYATRVTTTPGRTTSSRAASRGTTGRSAMRSAGSSKSKRSVRIGCRHSGTRVKPAGLESRAKVTAHGSGFRACRLRAPRTED